MVKNPPASAGDAGEVGLIPGLGRFPRRKWQPTPVSLPGKYRGQRSLVGYSLEGRKESDTTEHAHTLFFFLKPFNSFSYSSYLNV